MSVNAIVRNLALVAVGSTLTAGVAGGLASAETSHGGVARRAATAVPRGYHFGSDSLLQTQDFNDVGLRLDTETVQLSQSSPLAGCLGDATVFTIAGHELPSVGAEWNSERIQSQLITETAALAESAGRAATYAGRVVTRMERCQKPGGDYTYGAAHTVKARSGVVATYFVTYSHGVEAGAAAVLRNHAKLAVIEVVDPSNTATSVIRRLVTGGQARLG